MAMTSQMEYTLGDLLRPALVEVIRSQVATDTPTHVHPLLIPVAAVRALPDKFAVVFHDLDFSVVAADLTPGDSA